MAFIFYSLSIEKTLHLIFWKLDAKTNANSLSKNSQLVLVSGYLVTKLHPQRP